MSDNTKDPFAEFGGKLKENPFSEFGGDVLKKKENISLPSPSSATQLPSVLQEGQKLISGEVIKEKRPYSIGEGVKKDKEKENSILAGLYNTMVGSVSRIGGGLSYLQEYNPISKIAGKISDAYSLGYKGLKAQLSGNKEAQKEVQKSIKKEYYEPVIEKGGAEKRMKETQSFIEQARSQKSSKEFEKSKQFDYEKGLNLENVGNLAFTAPSQILDMAMGAVTGGSSFFYQSIADNANELEKTGAGKKLTDGQKLGYLVTQAAVQAALEKVSIDKILGHSGLGKKAVQKITGEVIEEFAQKGIKATSKQIQEAAIKKASQLSSKIKRGGLGIVQSVAPEAITEGIQSAGASGIKYVTNKLVGKEVFDEKDLKENFVKDIINSSIGGGVFGGVFGGGASLLKNTNKAIRNEIAKAQTPEDLAKIQNDLAQQVELGNITPQEAESANITAQQYAEIASKIPNTVEPETKSLIIGGIEQRENVKKEIEKINSEAQGIDESFLPEKQASIDLLNSKLGQINDYLDGLVTGVKTEYVKEGDKHFKIDSKGDKIEIPKEYYDIAIAVDKENERKAKEAELPTEVPIEETQVPIVDSLKDVESTAKALEGLSNSQMLEIPYTSGVDRGDRQGVSEAYHKAKADGGNPELVKAVENLLTQQTEQDAIQEQAASEVPVQSETTVSEEVEGGKPEAEVEGVTEKGEEEVEFTSKGGNKVVDESGNPLTVYHGTSKGIKASDLKQSGQAGDYGEGIYFTTDKTEAEQRNPENIIEANVKSGKHLVVGSQEYFDGIYKTLEKKYGSVIPRNAIGEEAKKAGYTSIEVERPEGKWVIAFDGVKIKESKSKEQTTVSETIPELKDVESTTKALDKIESTENNNVYYHATDNDDIISPDEIGYKKREGENVVQQGIYFGKDKEHLTDRYGNNIIKTILNIKNPLRIDNAYVDIDGRLIDYRSLSKDDINFLKNKGYDSIIFEMPDKNYSKWNETVVFDKNQITIINNKTSEAYHKAKENKNNPELVNTVEELLGKPKEEVKPTETEPIKLTEEQKQKAKETVDEIKKINLTHVEGTGMGSEQADGMYISTEKGGNRYATKDRPAKQVEVEIENPKVTTYEENKSLQKETTSELIEKEALGLEDVETEYWDGIKKHSGKGLSDITPKDVTNWFNSIKDKFKKETYEEYLKESGKLKVAKSITEKLKSEGYDALYIPESKNIEGELIVFDRSKVKEKGKEPSKVEPVKKSVTGIKPPKVEGDKITTISGKTEQERLDSIEKRKKETTVTEKVKAENDLWQDAQSLFSKNKNYLKSSEGLQELNRLRNKARALGFEVDLSRSAIVKKGKNGRLVKLKYNNKADSGAAVNENGIVILDRPKEVQDTFNEFNELGVFLDAKRPDGVRLTPEQIEGAIQDIIDGIPSNRANDYLDLLEKAIDENAYPIYDKGIGEANVRIEELRDALVGKENIGSPMDEESLISFLNEEANLTPEQEEQLLDNIDNLLTEYETEPTTELPTETRPETEVSAVESKTEEGVSTKAEPITETTKREPTEIEMAYEKAKADRGIRNANMKQFVTENKDSIIAQLKLENKIKQECK